MAIKEAAFRFGCGRYLQSPGAIGLIGAEAARFGASAWILSGKTAFDIASERLEGALHAAGIAFSVCRHHGTCNQEDARLFAEQARKYDLVIGVGGGVIMDLAKLVAVYADKPLINVPTSAATCAAYTPLSVCYTKEGKTTETVHHQKEADGVIADTELLLTEPPRLLVAGIFDALAKYIEIRHRYSCGTADSFPLGLDYAYHLSEKTHAVLCRELEPALLAMKEKTVTPAFEQVIFTLIAVTGVISSIARGSNQTALAHKFYENVRSLHTKEARNILHGELVGVGLLLQNSYNGTAKENQKLLELMARYGLPQSPSQCGLPTDGATKKQYSEALLASSAMQEGGDAGRLQLAMEDFWN